MLFNHVVYSVPKIRGVGQTFLFEWYGQNFWGNNIEEEKWEML